MINSNPEKLDESHQNDERMQDLAAERPIESD
jgi:hypothetical protein